MNFFLCHPGEHASITQNITDAAKNANSRAIFYNLSATGEVQINAIEKDLLNENVDAPFLLSISAAHHETGVINDIEAICNFVHKRGGYVHIDAAQAFGKVEMDWSLPDLITLSSHKMGGPVGIGALILKQGVPFRSVIHGGGQEEGLRPGTVPVALVHGFLAAAKESLSEESQSHWEQCGHGSK